MPKTTQLQQNRRTFTNYKKTDWTQFMEDTVRFRSVHHTHQHTHCQHNFYKHHTDGRQAQHTKEQDVQQFQALTRPHSMQNHIRRGNTCDPALKLLNEEITSNIQKYKQNLWKEHLDAHWDHRHNTHILRNTIHGLSNRGTPHTLNTSIKFNNKMATT